MQHVQWVRKVLTLFFCETETTITKSIFQTNPYIAAGRKAFEILIFAYKMRHGFRIYATMQTWET